MLPGNIKIDYIDNKDETFSRPTNQVSNPSDVEESIPFRVGGTKKPRPRQSENNSYS